MSSHIKKMCLAGVAIIVSSAVHAADMPIPVIEHVPEVPVVTGGWYLRGDIGYKVYQAPSVAYGPSNFANEKMDRTGMIGVGVGYKFSDYLRADVTVDYEFPAKVTGYAPCPAPCGGPGVGGFSTETADIDVLTFLVNGYIDLGTWAGFTPYVGAGIGTSYVTAKDVKFVNPNGTSGSYPGDSSWNFSWALMAGGSYELSQNWAIDAGYRYLNIGNAYSKSFSTGGANPSYKIRYEDLAAHEFRVGMRYTFNSGPAFLPEPIMAKY
ncbi:outer membrane protein [Stappia indica]|jgi:opacity protein-like surface antigen|uniref:Outer membrane beta-barrel protein n=1 Tax=Stappia indica TaxID=538381 RepID=A0A857C7H7_9HYPH|nr:outer membrane protein [Stappia indica]QGZ34825.1 outer membrane beta-barrel protein [Stappia indica]